jgi:acetyl-CoA C-acetyltransferase
MLSPVYIISAKRTPHGSFQGQLSAFQGWELGAEALSAALVESHRPEAVIMGNVLSAGQGQAPARQAACKAFGVKSITAVTINKVCGSGIQSIVFAAQAVQTGEYSVVMAGGMESMTNAPYLLPSARGGQRMGHGVTLDHMMIDGLEDAYEIPHDGKRRSMGTFGDATALKHGFSREDQEAFATQTYENYQRAEAAGEFDTERVPINHTDAKGNVTVINKDEPPTRVKPAKFSALRPAFSKTGL